MILGINNFIEASASERDGLDLTPWARGRFRPSALNENASLLVEVVVTYDRFDDPTLMELDYADGSTVAVLLEAGRSGVFGTSESHLPGRTGEALDFFVGYGLSTAPDALRFSVEESQAFFFDDEFDDILDGFLEPAPSFFTLSGHDEIHGAGFDDRLFGAAGNDIIRGFGGEDSLFGGQGNDTLIGGSDDDIIKGGVGGDVLRGNRGDDRIAGGGGADIGRGGAGSDTLLGGRGDDRLGGGGLGDVLRGQAGDDTLLGGTGDDKLFGNSGDDDMSGGGGSDTLIAGFGDDTLTGGSGVDRFVFAPNQASKLILDFENGVDKIAARGADSFADLFVFERDGDAVIRYRGVEITLDGVDSDLVDASDFLF